jgi:hypothetical protein
VQVQSQELHAEPIGCTSWNSGNLPETLGSTQARPGGAGALTRDIFDRIGRRPKLAEGSGFGTNLPETLEKYETPSRSILESGVVRVYTLQGRERSRMTIDTLKEPNLAPTYNKTTAAERTNFFTVCLMTREKVDSDEDIPYRGSLA